jgi:hypothetical protein
MPFSDNLLSVVTDASADIGPSELQRVESTRLGPRVPPESCTLPGRLCGQAMLGSSFQ